MFCDLGHVGENICLSATMLKLGTFGSTAFEERMCDKLFGLDTLNETIVYT